MTEQQTEVNIYPDPIAFVILGIADMARMDNKSDRLDKAMQILEVIEELTIIPKK